MTPNQCGSTREMETGVEDHSLGGSTSGPTGAPHSRQKRVSRGSSAPQLAQASAPARDALMPGFCPGLERA